MKFIILLGRDRMSEYESSIIKKIDSKYVVDKTVELANIDSPTGKEKEVALKYKEILEEVGMKVYLQEVENDRYNVIGVLRGEEPGYCSLMFNVTWIHHSLLMIHGKYSQEYHHIIEGSCRKLELREIIFMDLVSII